MAGAVEIKGPQIAQPKRVEGSYGPIRGQQDLPALPLPAVRTEDDLPTVHDIVLLTTALVGVILTEMHADGGLDSLQIGQDGLRIPGDLIRSGKRHRPKVLPAPGPKRTTVLAR